MVREIVRIFVGPPSPGPDPDPDLPPASRYPQSPPRVKQLVLFHGTLSKSHMESNVSATLVQGVIAAFGLGSTEVQDNKGWKGRWI